MSTGRDDLYRLIQSMSKSEKRYFKLEAKKAGDKTSNHIKLFDAINEMEEYDENKLRKKLRREKLIDHLPAEKRYLFQNILRSLRNFRSDKSIYAQIKAMILDSNYLIERGLYDQAGRILAKVQKIALKANDQLSLYEISIKKRELLRILKDKDYQKQKEKLIEESNHIFRVMASELEVQDIFDRLAIIVNKQLKLKDQGSINKLQSEMIALENNSGSDSPFLQLRTAQIKAFYYSLSGDLEKAAEYRNKVIEWWDDHPLIKGELFYLYRLSLNNLLSEYFATNQGEKVLEVLTKLESEAPKNAHEQAIIFQKVSISRLIYYMANGNFNTAIQMIPGIEDGIQKYKISKPTKFVLIVNVAILYFITDQHTKSMDWLNRVINDNKSSHRLDVQRVVRLFSIVNQIELGIDYPVIDNFCRATSRFFKISGLKEKEHSEYMILSFLRKYMNAPALEQKAILKTFKTALENIKNNPREKASLGLDEFYLWVRSKLENKPIHQFITEENA